MKEIEGTFARSFERPDPLYCLDNFFPLFENKRFSQIMEAKSKLEMPTILNIRNDYSRKLTMQDYMSSLREKNPNFNYATYSGKMPKDIKRNSFDIVIAVESFKHYNALEQISAGYKVLKEDGYLYGNGVLIDIDRLDKFYNYMEKSKSGFRMKFSENHAFFDSELTRRGFCFMDFAIHKEEKDDAISIDFKQMLQISRIRYAEQLSFLPRDQYFHK